MKNEIQNKLLENSKQNVAMNSRAFSFLLLKIWPEIHYFQETAKKLFVIIYDVA